MTDKAALIPIAEVDRVRGLIGEVVVSVHADDPRRLTELPAVYLQGPSGLEAHQVESFKRLGERAVVKLSGFDTIDSARALVGREIFMHRDDAAKPAEGEHFSWELEGMTVARRDGSVVGTVREVIRPAGQSLLVVDTPEREVLIPLVRSICVDIDTERQVITIEPPDGLLSLADGLHQEG
jgi:16S rRNA processing protein RimM